MASLKSQHGPPNSASTLYLSDYGPSTVNQDHDRSHERPYRQVPEYPGYRRSYASPRNRLNDLKMAAETVQSTAVSVQ